MYGNGMSLSLFFSSSSYRIDGKGPGAVVVVVVRQGWPRMRGSLGELGSSKMYCLQSLVSSVSVREKIGKRE